MRFLLIMRGAPGAGKTTLLNQLGLSPYALSMDSIRGLLAGPIMNRGGSFEINQKNINTVFSLFHRFIEERMQHGELLALDTTAQTNGDIDKELQLARKYNYKVALVDLSTVPIEQSQANNAQRAAPFRVPKEVIERAYERMGQQRPLGKNITIIPWKPDGSHVEAIKAFLTVPVHDLSTYESIVHVGDIQGCFDPLAGPGGILENGLKSENFYIFTGDLLDRGPENGKVMEWMLNHAVNKKNACILRGNHEDHLIRWVQGMPAVSKEFDERTRPQLEARGIDVAQAKNLTQSLLEAFLYTYHGHKVMVTHAGLPTFPGELGLALVSGEQLSHGTGEWSDPVDSQFNRYAPQDWYQVHGHRNHGMMAIHATERSFNLEDSVENGGHLRAVVLDKNGWTPLSVRNRNYLKYRERMPSFFNTGVPDWMTRDSETTLDPEILSIMREHSGVKEKTSVRSPHIASLNFTKQVFFDKSWDDVVVKARGLFFDTESGQIAARSYEKFFNINERPETQMDALKDNLAWPITLYLKANGFLGLIGIDPKSEDLFITSKSTPDGDFSDYFRTIFNEEVSPQKQEKLRRWLVDNDASIAVEVIDPKNDPHMIDYDRAHLVVLDVFHRSTRNEKLPYEKLVAFCSKFELTVKERGMEFKNFASFAGWHKAATKNLAYRHSGRDIEGYVIEDNNGFQTKVKLPHYAFWKKMRSAKGRLGRVKEKAQDARERMALKQAKGEKGTREAAEADRYTREWQGVLNKDPHPMAKAFLSWADQLPLEQLNQDILTLRKAFDQEVGIRPEWMEEPWMAFDPSEGEALKAEKTKKNKP